MGKGEKSSSRTFGNHVASRLTEIGIKDLFCVPGDFNMTVSCERLSRLAAS